MATSLDQNTLQLMQDMYFTGDDLQYNRRAQLSPSQIEMMKARKASAQEQVRLAPKRFPFIMVYFVVIVAILVGVFIATGAFQSVQTALGQWTLPAMAGVGVLLLLWLAMIPRSYRRGIERGRVAAENMSITPPVLSVAGDVSLKFYRSGGTEGNAMVIDSYLVRVGRKEFSVDKSRYDLYKGRVTFKHGVQYRIYYADTGKSGLMLSAETI